MPRRATGPTRDAPKRALSPTTHLSSYVPDFQAASYSLDDYLDASLDARAVMLEQYRARHKCFKPELRRHLARVAKAHHAVTGTPIRHPIPIPDTAPDTGDVARSQSAIEIAGTIAAVREIGPTTIRAFAEHTHTSKTAAATRLRNAWECGLLYRESTPGSRAYTYTTTDG